MYFKIKSEQTKVVNKNDKLNEIMIRYMIIISEKWKQKTEKKKEEKDSQSLLGKRGRLCMDIQHRDRREGRGRYNEGFFIPKHCPKKRERVFFS